MGRMATSGRRETQRPHPYRASSRCTDSWLRFDSPRPCFMLHIATAWPHITMALPVTTRVLPVTTTAQPATTTILPVADPLPDPPMKSGRWAMGIAALLGSQSWAAWAACPGSAPHRVFDDPPVDIF